MVPGPRERIRPTAGHAAPGRPWPGIVPPFIIERMAASGDPQVQQEALENIAMAAECRAVRTTLASAPGLSALGTATGRKDRRIYDVKNRQVWFLPGRLVRSEGEPDSTDEAVNEAYDFSGTVYDFYMDLFERNSIDDRGMTLISSVHLGRKFNNAFWTGSQMAYGDGDGRVFRRFTRSLDVVGHELTHGVITFTSNLEYQDESGALNESFADVFGVLVTQWANNESVDDATWLVGEEIMIPAPTRRALRDMAAPGTAYDNDIFLGSDPQPAHVRDQYKGGDDNGGVHINSGIPNHAFYRFASDLGGNAWEKAGRVWYDTLLALHSRSQFSDCARTTHAVAGMLFGDGSVEQQSLRTAWKAVGIDI